MLTQKTLESTQALVRSGFCRRERSPHRTDPSHSAVQRVRPTP